MLLMHGHIHPSLFLISLRPKNCVKKLLKRGYMHCNLFLMSIRPRKCMKKLLLRRHVYRNLFLISKIPKRYVKELLNLFRMSLFGASHGRGVWQKGPLPKICYTILRWWNFAQLCFTERRSKKYINRLTNPLNSADNSIFSRKISNIRYIKKYRYTLHFNT